MTSDSDYPWIEPYMEIARRLLSYEERQGELIECLRSLSEPPGELPIISLQDQWGEETRPLESIDLFTFFAAFNRKLSLEHRQRVVAEVQRFLGLPEAPPESFQGVPVVNNMSSWFFPFGRTRKPDDIPSLWRLARQAIEGGLSGVDGATFDRCLRIESVRIAKLTMGLFWVRPDEFMPCDGNSQRLFRSMGLEKPRDFASYRALVDRLQAKAGDHFASLSYEAWDDEDADEEAVVEATSGERRRALREDPAKAREILEGLYDTRRELEAALQVLVDGIRRAHSQHEGCWSLSLRRRRIRLTVGKLLVTDLRRGEILLGVLWEQMPQATRDRLEAWVHKGGGEFAVRMPRAALLKMPLSAFTELDEADRKSLVGARDALIDQLGLSGRSPYRRAHSPGVLGALRELLSEEIPDPDYGESIEDPWDEFVRWGREIYASPQAMEDERPYKLEIAQNAHAVLEALDEPAETWLPLLRRTFGPPNNLTFYMDHQRLVEWATAHPEQAKAALSALWDEDRALGERVDRFSALVPASVLRAVGSRANIASVLLSGLGAEDHPPFQSTVFWKGYQLTAFGAPAPEASAGTHYAHAIRFLDRMLDEFAARDAPLRDRLDAQCILWCLAKASRDTTAVAPEHLEDLLRYVGESPAVWLLVDERSDTALVEPESVWMAKERLGDEALAPDLRLEHLRDDEVVLRTDGERIWGISSVRQRARDAKRPGTGRGEPGRRIRLDTLRLEQPIALSEIPLDARRSDRQAFDDRGDPRAGLLFRLSTELSHLLRERFADRFPEESPWAPTRRNLWLFQSNPEYWSLSNWLRDRREGDEGEHSVRAHREEIRPGDRIALWQSGPEGGVYALGEIISEVYERPAGEWSKRRGETAETENAVRFRLTKKIDPPILRNHILEDPALSGLDVVRQPRGTNYRLTPEQWKALEDRIEPSPVPEPEVLTLSEIHQAVQRHGLRIPLRTLRRFHHSLKTRGFVILCGPSGTGKTWLAECYAEAIGAASALVPVAPNWTSNEDLLGHWNPLDGTYHHTDFSRFLQRAAEEWARAKEADRRPRDHLVILDEMNLARVEHYFAEFLSKMEVRSRKGHAKVPLGPDDETFLTPNLLFVGTVNVDETTHGFADKVYDRAQTLELGIAREDLAAHVEGQEYATALLEFWDAVEPVAPFAYRIADEIRRYVDAAAEDEVAWEDALDEQILQKVLPQLTGAEPQLRDALQQVVDLAGERFPLTRRKAERMLADFELHGFASYF